MDNVKGIELKDTVSMMTSNDYKDRFRAEYHQNVIRYNKLQMMLKKWDAGELNFDPICPRGVYDLQIKAMKDYISVLKDRAAMEKIIL